jgi:hypothetical protein
VAGKPRKASLCGEHHAGHDLIGLRNEVLDVAPVFAESVGDVANVFTELRVASLDRAERSPERDVRRKDLGYDGRSGRFQTSR